MLILLMFRVVFIWFVSNLIRRDDSSCSRMFIKSSKVNVSIIFAPIVFSSGNVSLFIYFHMISRVFSSFFPSPNSGGGKTEKGQRKMIVPFYFLRFPRAFAVGAIVLRHSPRLFLCFTRPFFAPIRARKVSLNSESSPRGDECFLLSAINNAHNKSRVYII